MSSCRDIQNALTELAARRPEELPPVVRQHLAECAPCARAVWARRAMQETLERLLMQRKRSEYESRG